MKNRKLMKIFQVLTTALVTGSMMFSIISADMSESDALSVNNSQTENNIEEQMDLPSEIPEEDDVKQQEEGTEIYWSLKNGVLRISGEGTVKDLVGGLIATQKFSDYEVSDIVFEKDSKITSIERYAFDRYENLRSVQMFGSVKSIGERAFGECPKLSYVKLSDDLQYIGKAAFKFCDNLKEIYIPDSVTIIDEVSFYGCYNLEKVHFPKSLQTMGRGAFFECGKIEDMSSLPEGANVDPAAFNLYTEDDYVTDVQDDDIKQEIGNTGVYWSLRDGIMKISGKGEIPSDFEDGVVYDLPWKDRKNEIEQLIFDKDSEISRIGYYAFSGCFRLRSVQMLGSVKRIGKCNFESSDLLTKLKLSDDLEFVDDCVFRFDYAIDVENLILPDKIESIGAFAFEGLNKVKHIHFPSSLKVLTPNAFYKLNNLEEIILPDGLEEIGHSAFNICPKVTTIVVPDSVKKIDDRAFFSCFSLKKVIMSHKTQDVGRYAFFEHPEDTVFEYID